MGQPVRREEAAVAALRTSQLFREVHADRLQPLARTMRPGDFTKGETVVAASDAPEHLVLVIEGRAHIMRVSRDGNELVLGELCTGDIYGLALVARRGCCENALSAASAELHVYYLPLADVERTMEADSALCLRALRLVSETALDLCANVEEQAFEPMRARLAHTLAAVAHEDGDHLVVEHTRKELAALVGSRPEEVSRTLPQLASSGLIRVRRRSEIEVLDPGGLAAYE